jgi:hypothetical protein
MHRESRLVSAFLELSDIDIHDFNAVSYALLLARHATRLLDADAAGLLLVSDDGELEQQGATTIAARELLFLQLRLGTGPGVESVRTNRPINSVDLRDEPRWRQFRDAGLAAGFSSVHTLPLGVHETVLGSITLFRRRAGRLTADELAIGESLVRAATTYLVLQRAFETSETLSAQLQKALNARLEIEQAKGILAERRGSTLAGAFEAMRSFARHDRRQLGEVAHAVIEDCPSVASLTFRREIPRKPRNHRHNH